MVAQKTYPRSTTESICAYQIQAQSLMKGSDWLMWLNAWMHGGSGPKLNLVDISRLGTQTKLRPDPIQEPII